MIRNRKPPSQGWRTFLENHAKEIIATDFFTVPTTTFRVLFVLVILSHDRREILHTNVTDTPAAEWTARQVIEAVGTSAAAFIGETARGLIQRRLIHLITSCYEYLCYFGSVIAAGKHMPSTVEGFFDSGGWRCCIVRIGGFGHWSSRLYSYFSAHSGVKAHCSEPGKERRSRYPLAAR